MLTTAMAKLPSAGWTDSFLNNITLVDSNTVNGLTSLCDEMIDAGLDYVPRSVQVNVETGTIESMDDRYDIETQFLAIAALGSELGDACRDVTLPLTMWLYAVYNATVPGSQRALSSVPRGNTTSPYIMQLALIAGERL